MRLGLIAYSTNTGLGIQTRQYYQQLAPTKTLVIDLSRFNQMPQHPEWYPKRAEFVMGFPTDTQYIKFLEGLDVVLLAETPLNHNLFTIAKQKGVRTAMAANFEFLDNLERELPLPDMLIFPSAWRIEESIERFGSRCKVQVLPMGVDTSVLHWKRRAEARTFLHIAGRPAVHDRNGTEIVLEAANWTSAKFIILTQEAAYATQLRHKASENVRVEHSTFEDYTKLYSLGDVLVMPRRYGGLCLPANEALATGMPVIMPDIDPNNRWLPEKWLVPAAKTGEFMTRTRIDIYSTEPADLADKVAEFVAMDKLFAFENLQAKMLSEQMSWHTLRPKYLEELELLCGTPD